MHRRGRWPGAAFADRKRHPRIDVPRPAGRFRRCRRWMQFFAPAAGPSVGAAAAPDSRSTSGSTRRPDRKRMIRRAGQGDDGNLPSRPIAAVRPGWSARPWASTSPRWASAVTAASLRPTPLPPIVSRRSQVGDPSASAIDAASRAAASMRLHIQPCGACDAPQSNAWSPRTWNIDDAQPRTAHAQLFQSAGGAREQQSAQDG